MSDPKLLKEILAQAPQNSHLGSKMITSSEVDIGDMIEKSGCNDKYTDLEECLGEHDRDWRKCQAEVLNKQLTFLSLSAVCKVLNKSSRTRRSQTPITIKQYNYDHAGESIEEM